jgi:hypothetical protein
VCSFQLAAEDMWGGVDYDVVCDAFTATATAAAAAGEPLRLQRLHIPFMASMLLPPPSALVTALPFLRHLSISLDAWGQRGVPKEVGPFLIALSGLHHLQSLALGMWDADHLVTDEEEHPLRWWEQVLEAAPKQLQQLSVQLLRARAPYGPRATLAYTWEALAPFTQLRQLKLDNVAAECDLAPLTHLPALTSLGIKQTKDDGNIQPLVAVQGLLRDLHVDTLRADQQQYLEQLTALTSLTMTWSFGSCSQCPVPQQVAAGLRRLDWTLGKGIEIRDSVAAGQQLAKCSGKLQDLQLRGQAWADDLAAVAVAGALRQLTGLTAFGLHCVPSPKSAISLTAWRSQLPMQHLKQLRSLALPMELLAAAHGWLGGLEHLSRLHMTVGWARPADGDTWGPEQVFGAHEARLLANLRSCSSLGVFEAHVVLTNVKGGFLVEGLPVVPAVKAWLKRQLPGVYTLLTWGTDEGNMHVVADPVYLDSEEEDDALGERDV